MRDYVVDGVLGPPHRRQATLEHAGEEGLGDPLQLAAVAVEVAVARIVEVAVLEDASPTDTGDAPMLAGRSEDDRTEPRVARVGADPTEHHRRSPIAER